MSVEKISDFAVGDIDLTAMMSTLNKAYKGQAQVTLSNYDNDSAPVVKVGSVFDNNGTQYAVTGSDETPTGYSGISNSTIFYLYFDESAEAFIYSSTSPSWSDDLQGWYNGNDRALFSMYKDSGGTKYQNKTILVSMSLSKQNIDSQSMHIQDQKSSGTDGGSSSTGIHTRILNTVIFNTISGASLSSNRITLPPGTYKIHATAPTTDCAKTRLHIYNVTNSSVLLLGNGVYTNTSGVILAPIVTGYFTLTTETEIELRQYFQTAKADVGLGSDVSDGFSEIYADMTIDKIE